MVATLDLNHYRRNYYTNTTAVCNVTHLLCLQIENQAGSLLRLTGRLKNSASRTRSVLSDGFVQELEELVEIMPELLLCLPFIPRPIRQSSFIHDGPASWHPALILPLALHSWPGTQSPRNTNEGRGASKDVVTHTSYTVCALTTPRM